MSEHVRELEAASRRLPDDSNRALSRQMLRTWVLEHAGDEEDANAQTSETDWEAVRDDVFRPGDLDWHPEIFAYQIRGHFSEIGLTVPAEAIERMIRRADALRQEVLTTHADRADVAYDEYNGRTFEVTGVSEEFCAFVSGELPDHDMEASRRSRAHVRVTLDLGTDDHSCYLDNLHYEVDFPDGSRGFRSVRVYDPGQGVGGRMTRAIDQVVGVPEQYENLTEVDFYHSPD